MPEEIQQLSRKIGQGHKLVLSILKFLEENNDERALLEATGHGTKNFNEIPLIIAGDTGAGKTSGVRVLEGEEFVEEHISTDSADILRVRVVPDRDQPFTKVGAVDLGEELARAQKGRVWEGERQGKRRRESERYFEITKTRW